MEQSTRTLTRSQLLALFTLIAALTLGGCARTAGADDDPFVVADLFATPGRAIATLSISPTPEPSSTQPNAPTVTPGPTLPLPTAILYQPTMPLATPGPTPTRAIDAEATVTPTPACAAPPAPFGSAWAAAGELRALLGCASGSVQTVNGVWQPYEHGAMFWREQDSSIFVLSNLTVQQGQTTDSWWRFDDTYQEGEPEADIGMSPPAGMTMPVRGFGKVWKNNGFVRDALGWATSGEEGMQSTWLQFDNGWMMTGPDGRPVYALVPLDAPPYTNGLHSGPLTP